MFNELQLQSVFGANRRWVAMGPIFGMWEVWVETTQTHCLGRHTKLTPPGPPFRPANSSSRYWFRIQCRELELKTFTPIIQQCFQSCIHTAYSPYYSNIYMDLWNHWRMIPKHRCFVPQKNSKILPSNAARKPCMFLFPRSLQKLIVAMATALVDTGAFERRK